MNETTNGRVHSLRADIDSVRMAEIVRSWMKWLHVSATILIRHPAAADLRNPDTGVEVGVGYSGKAPFNSVSTRIHPPQAIVRSRAVNKVDGVPGVHRADAVNERDPRPIENSSLDRLAHDSASK